MSLKRILRKPPVIIGIIVMIIFVALLVYVRFEIAAISATLTTIPSGPPPIPSISASLVNQSFMSYDSGSYLVPYALLHIVSRNLSSINVRASLLLRPAPAHVYIFDTSDECYKCGDTSLMASTLESDLVRYDGVSGPSNFSYVAENDVANITNNSVLVVPNGFLPAIMLSTAPNSTNATVLDELLSRGVSIVYVGGPFSNLLEPGSAIIPATAPPAYLYTHALNASVMAGLANSSQFNFKAPAFALTNGLFYGPISYENVMNGSIVVFGNYSTAWTNATYEGADLAKAIALLFWMPRYAYHDGYIKPANSTSTNSNVGIAMLNSSVSYNYTNTLALERGSGVITLYTNASYGLAPLSRYVRIEYKPSFTINGSIAMPSYVVPGVSTYTNMTVFTHSSVPKTLLPHLSIYSINMSPVMQIPLPTISGATGNYKFVKYLTFDLPSGSYIAALQNFSGATSALSLFNVNISVALLSSNFANGAFTLTAFSHGTPVSGLPYSITVNGRYRENGTLSNGTISYILPAGSPEIYGTVNFVVSLLSSNYTVSTSNIAPTVQINSDYIALAIVAVVMILMITLVRAPNRDEFYIDVPHLPPKNRLPIKVRANDILGVFDRMGLYYHWHFMPFSKSEVRMAIAKYVNMGGMPVNLTMNNVDRILDQLVAAGLVYTASDLYAPKSWITQSGHDIEYLATFKKLRVFLVTHGYSFTDIDSSNTADIVATMHGEHAYIVIYSKTTKFTKMPMQSGIKTYLAFLDAAKLEDFRAVLYNTNNNEAEAIKLYLASGVLELIDADDPHQLTLS